MRQLVVLLHSFSQRVSTFVLCGGCWRIQRTTDNHYHQRPPHREFDLHSLQTEEMHRRKRLKVMCERGGLHSGYPYFLTDH